MYSKQVTTLSMSQIQYNCILVQETNYLYFSGRNEKPGIARLNKSTLAHSVDNLAHSVENFMHIYTVHVYQIAILYNTVALLNSVLDCPLGGILTIPFSSRPIHFCLCVIPNNHDNHVDNHVSESATMALSTDI